MTHLKVARMKVLDSSKIKKKCQGDDIVAKFDPTFRRVKKPASGYLKISHFCQSQHSSQSLGLA